MLPQPANLTGVHLVEGASISAITAGAIRIISRAGKAPASPAGRRSCHDEHQGQQATLPLAQGASNLAGVCGGVADYLGVDPTLVRLFWVIFAIAGGPGVLLYLIMAVVVPEEPEFVQASAEKAKNEDVD